jgi:hypothetical protein
MKRLFLIFVLVAAVFALPASAGKYSPTLTLSPSTVQAGDHFDVSGSGFSQAYGNVIIGFAGGSWGGPVASDGTFTIGPIAALSGDTLPAGTYPVIAYQQVHGNRFSQVAEATLTVTS